MSSTKRQANPNMTRELIKEGKMYEDNQSSCSRDKIFK